MDRELAYDGKRLEALVKYFKGHPYDTEMMLGYRVSLRQQMGMNRMRVLTGNGWSGDTHT